jgi:hypothetical protein
MFLEPGVKVDYLKRAVAERMFSECRDDTAFARKGLHLLHENELTGTVSGTILQTQLF